ncbi:hypothetical protein SD70_11090 [Gordoniibacillus kamchatkensis]|uniref:Uncharacterized protein n=1 Tax=Gordoniibacillus kamchatkensis TaxID=1590651 RepID=A0ABR5AID0_9BACL|nr:hypothetical protein [Paenibacillus sp. VKM B-2647]KIL40786.1 hypothetical protein SD70_11090 [Paenibacillus sp. VKM B-2647]
MEHPFSAMNEHKLIKEYMLLSKVHQNLAALAIYNPDLEKAVRDVDADLKKIKGQLFFRYRNHRRVDLGSVVFTGSELQSRMEKYIHPGALP